MNFHQKLQLFESRSTPSSPLPTPSPQSPATPSPSSAAERARSALAPSPPPVLPTPLNPPAIDDTSSDYSDVGDYAQDKDFYVPGVNEISVVRARGNRREAHVVNVVEGALGRLGDSEEEDSEDEEDEEDDEDDGEEGEEEEGGEVVRQHSNFSRLSAQSWLTVDSAQEVDGEVEAPPRVPRANREVRRDAPLPENFSYNPTNDHDPATLFGIDIGGGALEEVMTKSVVDMSVFECCAVLQSGVPAYKKKSFRRFGARRVWLSPGCDHLLWTSKKNSLQMDCIKLQKVHKMKCIDREVSIDVVEGYRMSLLFANAEEAALWVRALSCLIPLQARISRAPRGVVPADKEREDFNLSDDYFNGRPLHEYMAVNAYVVLCAAKGQPFSMGNKLAFSRSDASFCGLRYIPHRLVPHILKTQQEIAVLKRLQHANIVKYHECLLDTEHGGNYVVYEYLPRGSLMDCSKLEGVKAIAEGACRDLIWDIISGLEYLHTLRIAHADIRPDNLLRDVNGAVKVNALGCITHDFTDITNMGTLVKARLGECSPAFIAPELCWLVEEAPVGHAKSYAMDVWSVGVVLYFMLYGRVPFGGRDDRGIQESIVHGKLRFPRLPATSSRVRSLLKGVLGEKDPKTRIGLTELKMHPWFTDAESGRFGGGSSGEGVRLIVSPEEVDSAVQVGKVRVTSKRR